MAFPAWLCHRERHRLRQGKPHVQALAPYKRGRNQPEVVRHVRIPSQANARKRQHRRRHQRFSQPRQQRQDKQRRDAAALPPRLEHALLMTRQAHGVADEVRVDAHLKRKRKTDPANRQPEKEHPPPPVRKMHLRVEWNLIDSLRIKSHGRDSNLPAGQWRSKKLSQLH